ncbi:MAG TPA: glycosyltransferase family A protein, partial [Clostridia bacterium]|nr:glycosyltransferase family A protein [Clostridia bacterium]
IRITVFTPVYNRKHTIHRVFDSLMKQTYKGFHWLVIDDGSTDGIKEVIDDYAKKADFEVSYYYKENGGKHTAINMACGMMETEYVVILDSDNAMIENSLERMLYYWDALPEEKRGEYWCVVGYTIDPYNGDVVGEKFPDNINESDNPLKVASTVEGDKFGCLKTDILKQFPFPEPEGTTFITESIVWNKIDREYKQYYINEPLLIYYYDEPDSLTNAWYKEHVEEGYVSNYFWRLSQLNDTGIKNADDLKLLLRVPYYGFMSKKKAKEILKQLESPLHKVAVCAMLPPAFMLKIFRGEKHIKNG